MSSFDYLLFVLIAVAQVGSPGPSTIFLVNNALIHGVSRALWILTGDLLAIAALAGLSLLGIDALLRANPTVFVIIKLAGAGYLVWLGIQHIHLFRGGLIAKDQGLSERLSSLWAKSFMVGISNPKAILFFSALLPQFVGAPQEASLATLLGLILVFLLVKFMVSAAYAIGAKGISHRLAKPGAAIWGKRLTGSVLIIFGLAMGKSALA